MQSTKEVRRTALAAFASWFGLPHPDADVDAIDIFQFEEIVGEVAETRTLAGKAWDYLRGFAGASEATINVLSFDRRMVEKAPGLLRAAEKVAPDLVAKVRQRLQMDPETRRSEMDRKWEEPIAAPA